MYGSILRQKVIITQIINLFMNKVLPTNDLRAAISMVAGMIVVGFTDNVIIFIS